MKFNESIYNKERKENVTIELDSNTIVHEIKKLRNLGYAPGRIAYEMELPGDLVETYRLEFRRACIRLFKPFLVVSRILNHLIGLKWLESLYTRSQGYCRGLKRKEKL